MLLRNVVLSFLLIFVFVVLNLFVWTDHSRADHAELAKGKKILVVASYHKGYKWLDDIVQTMEQELSGAALTVFYMDSKRNFAGAEEKAKEAYSLYKKLEPDAVIAVDDNAQSFFVVPYLKGKDAVPVIFCGVNDDASKYGFPAENVTGVLEKKHYLESISFAQIIDPKIRAIAVLYRPSPSNNSNLEQIEKEKAGYSADIIATVAVETVTDLQKALVDFSTEVDAFILLNMTGILDNNNKPLEGHSAISLAVDATDKVTIGASDWEVEAGALCGVIKSGEEQGVLAASMLIEHWKGKSINSLPLLSNKNGQRYLNVRTMKKLRIKLRPEMVIGTKIISKI